MHERLVAFQEQAEVLTPVPAFEDIEQRGWARRRRRRAVIGVVAAGVIAVTGVLATANGRAPQPMPADDADSPRDKVLFIGVESPATVTFDRPDDWTMEGWGTGNRAKHDRHVARFAAAVVTDVAKDPCRFTRGQTDWRVAASEPTQLATQLSSMAGVREVQEPLPDDRFGVPALHLRLEGTGPACTAEEGALHPFWAYQDFADGGRWPDPVGVADLWLLDVGDQVVLVEAVTGREVSAEDRDTLRQVIDSVEVAPAAAD